MENLFFITTIVFSILGSIFIIFLVAVGIFIVIKTRSLILNLEKTSENVSSISESIKEKIRSVGVTEALTKLINKIVERRKNDE